MAHCTAWRPQPDAPHRALIYELRGHDSHLNSCTFSPDNRTIATSSVDRTIRLWNTATGALLRVITAGERYGIDQVVFSKDGSRISGLWCGTLITWDFETGSELVQGKAGLSHIAGFTISQDGQYLLIFGSNQLEPGSSAPAVRLLNAQSGMLSVSFLGTKK